MYELDLKLEIKAETQIFTKHHKLQGENFSQKSELFSDEPWFKLSQYHIESNTQGD